MKDLGWANGWPMDDNGIVNPPELIKCRELGHKRKDVDIGPPHRGMHHVVTCDECQIKYHYDSSD